MKTHGAWILAAVLAVSLGWARPSYAQQDEYLAASVGVQYALIGIIAENDGTSKVGFDANYATKMLTAPKTPLAITAGAIAEVGWHKWDDFGSLTLIQGGIQLKSERFRTERLALNARIMGGIGHYSGEGTDFNFILMPGLDIFLPGDKPYRLRVEAGQVWDVFDGGKLAHWRYGFGIVKPLE